MKAFLFQLLLASLLGAAERFPVKASNGIRDDTQGLSIIRDAMFGPLPF